jgi:hypothetical protein
MPKNSIELYFENDKNDTQYFLFDQTSNVVIDQLNENKNLKINHEFLMHAIAELLQYINHGTNFFFYILSGKTFRNEIKKSFFQK